MGSEVTRSGPPAYAWDWFARQRLLWREVRARLGATAGPAAVRYHAVDTRAEVLALLRADYPHDPVVRSAVDLTVAEVAFLGRVHGRFADLEVRSAPRGMRWWWTALTGEELDVPDPETQPPPPAQLSLDDVQQGYGG